MISDRQLTRLGLTREAYDAEQREHAELPPVARRDDDWDEDDDS